MTDTPKYAVEATGTSLTIFEALVEAERPIGVTALSERIDVSKSVVHNHLSTLRARGFVVKHGEQYKPSLRTLRLGNRTRQRLGVYRAARPSLDNLTAATGETTTLFVLEEDWGVPAYVVDANDERPVTFEEGERLPLPVTAPGKAILASLSDDHVDRILHSTELTPLTDKTVTDPDELEAQVRRIRDDGIAFCREEHREDVVGVAAPIETGETHSVAALGICGPAERLNGRYLEEDITGQVLSTAKSIQVELTSG